MRVNELEFLNRMYLYAVTSIGTFRIDIRLQNTTLKTYIDKITAKPFELNMPVDAVVNDYTMAAHAADAFALDMAVDTTIANFTAENAAVVVFKIVDVVADAEASFEIIGCSSKALSVLNRLENVSSIISAVAAKVIAFANDIALNDSIISIDAQDATAKNSVIDFALEKLLLDLNIDITTASTTNFALSIDMNSNVDISIAAFEAALLQLAITCSCGISLEAISAKADTFEQDISVDIVTSIVATILKYMRIGDYDGVTIGTMSSNTLEELTIRIR